MEPTDRRQLALTNARGASLLIPELWVALGESGPESGTRRSGAGWGGACGGNSGRDWSLEAGFWLAGAGWENGCQCRGCCGARRSSGCAVIPLWVQLSACVGSSPLGNKPVSALRPVSWWEAVAARYGRKAGPGSLPGAGGPADGAVRA